MVSLLAGNPPLAEVQRLVQVLHADKTSDSEVAELCRILRENGRDIVAQDPGKLTKSASGLQLKPIIIHRENKDLEVEHQSVKYIHV